MNENEKLVLLNRISFLRTQHGYFKRTLDQWKDVYVNNLHLDEVDFSKLNPADLVDTFGLINRIIAVRYKIAL
jgi:hypothetical protein